MLEVLDVCGPSPKQWDMVIRGIRNPFKGQSGGDSVYCPVSKPLVFKRDCDDTNCKYNQGPTGDGVASYCSLWEESDGRMVEGSFAFGEKDLKLATGLANRGPDHGKFLRELPVIIECRAPLFWWKQLDAYRVGVPAMNSESTMHTIQKKKFELSDFSLSYSGGDVENFLRSVIIQLNRLRDDYLELEAYKKEFENGDHTNLQKFVWDWMHSEPDEQSDSIPDEELVVFVDEYKKDVWRAMVEMLPESYFQTRTFITTYAGLRNMFGQRVVNPHKLTEWRDLFDQLQPQLPFFNEFIVGNQYDKKENDKIIFVLKGCGKTDPKEFWDKVKKDKIIKLENNDGEE